MADDTHTEENLTPLQRSLLEAYRATASSGSIVASELAALDREEQELEDRYSLQKSALQERRQEAKEAKGRWDRELAKVDALMQEHGVRLTHRTEVEEPDGSVEMAAEGGQGTEETPPVKPAIQDALVDFYKRQPEFTGRASDAIRHANMLRGDPADSVSARPQIARLKKKGTLRQLSRGLYQLVDAGERSSTDATMH